MYGMMSVSGPGNLYAARSDSIRTMPGMAITRSANSCLSFDDKEPLCRGPLRWLETSAATIANWQTVHTITRRSCKCTKGF